MSHAPTVLILGAHGRLGAAATHAFAAAGWRVLAQVRRLPACLPTGVDTLSVPLANTADLVHAAAGAQVVVYAVNPTYTAWPEHLLPLARQGMAVAKALGARFMLPGNVYNMGRELPARITLDSPMVADTRKGALRIELEGELQRAAQAGELRSVVIRAGDFFGSGQGSWLDLAIAKDLRRGKLVYPGPLDLPHAWAYLPDLAQAFVGVAGDGDDASWRHWLFEGHTLTGEQWLSGLKQVAEARGWAPEGGWRQGGIPWWLLKAASPLVPMWRELSEMAYLWQRPHAIDGSALRAHLPTLPHTPTPSCIERSVLAMVS